jgi:hypothetical protein
MKNVLLLLSIALISVNICKAQEWFTSFDVAKRLALAQDKMLLVMWESTLDNAYPIRVHNEKGDAVMVDLNENEIVNALIWEHFIPVIIFESKYDELYSDAKKTRGERYLDKLGDDSIKIMDVNGNILNTKISMDFNQNLTLLIKKYALNTSFLKHELVRYSKDNNSTSAFLLASKYLDFAILLNQGIRPEIIALANIYFKEAKDKLIESNFNNKLAYLQKLKLLKIKEQLILNRPKKANRMLKRVQVSEIDSINQSLYNFLNYTTFKLLKDENNTALWKTKLSNLHLKKAELILKNNI